MKAFSKQALEIASKRWARKGDDGQAIETLEEIYDRVAGFVAQGDPDWRRKYYDALINKQMVVSSPIATGANTRLTMMSACTVVPIEDNLPSILMASVYAGMAQKGGAGVGFSGGRIRGRGSLIHSSKGKASGAVSVLKHLNSTADMVKQGARRGANMFVLPVDHADIWEFIEAKKVEGALANFNISVAATDAFMQAVKAGDPDQCKLYRAITQNAWHIGEPGMLYIDTANRANTVPHLYTFEATNPCGEQWLGPFGSCCLTSLNLAAFVVDGQVDWAALVAAVHVAVRFLDSVIDVNGYVEHVPQFRDAALQERRIGLGITGLWDALVMLGLPYDSEEGRAKAAKIMEWVQFHAMDASLQLAKEKGAFPAIKGSVFDPANFTWQPPESELDWVYLIEQIKEHGIRNCAVTTIMPTGTASNVIEVEGYGCEPAFALAYQRNFEGQAITYRSELFVAALIAAGFDSQRIEAIVDRVAVTGSCQDIDELPPHIKALFKVAGDISPRDHVLMLAALQQFVCNSVSKTINMPHDATVEDVEHVYMLAWELGCKGLTVYRQGSRETVVLETVKAKPAVNGVDVLPGYRYKVKTPTGSAYVAVFERDGEPFESFVIAGKAGGDLPALAEMAGRLVSNTLQQDSPIPPRKRLEQVMNHLHGIGGRTSIGLGPAKVSSLPDGIARAYQQYLDKPAIVKSNGDLCPTCGNALTHSQGCKRCEFCNVDFCG